MKKRQKDYRQDCTLDVCVEHRFSGYMIGSRFSGFMVSCDCKRIVWVSTVWCDSNPEWEVCQALLP